MRINKFISHNTNYSRREADELVKNGKVSVNNKVIDNLATDVKED
ncbi:S4 domain-containing protein, partial [Campylobacter fetus]